MTTANDNRQKRDANEAWTDAQEYTMGVPPINNVDPSAAYPNISYSFGFSINHGATGAEVQELWSGAGVRDVDLVLPSIRPSIFPYNQVNETPGGHVIGVDDTPGGERILIKHRTGAGVEMKPDGSVIISSRKNRVEVTEGNSVVNVKGEAHLVYEGNLTMSVTGDMKLNVGGNYIVDVDGEENKVVKGSKKERVLRNYNLDVLENRSAVVLGDDVFVCAKERTDVIDGKYEVIVDNDIFFRTSKDINFSAEKDISFAGEAFSAVAKDIAVIGASGTIGGEEVEHYGNIFSGPSDGTGDETTFYGTLIGLAHEATTSEYALYAAETHAAFSATFASTANYISNIPNISSSSIAIAPSYEMSMEFHQNNPEWRMPTQSIVEAILEQSDKGIKKTRVFEEEITERISRSDWYDQVFRHKPTLQEIRIAMRDEGFREGDAPHILVSQGLLHPEWASGLPSDIKKVEDANATSRFGVNRIGNSIELISDKFRVRK